MCSYTCGPDRILRKTAIEYPAFESDFIGHIQERGQKVKRLKIAEIRAEIKPPIQSRVPKGRERIKRNIYIAKLLTLPPFS